MSLTGPEIEKQMAEDRIDIDPKPEQIGPNSVDLRVYGQLDVYFAGKEMHEYLEKTAPCNAVDPNHLLKLMYEAPPLDLKKRDTTYTLPLTEEGTVLYPGILYLARTVERVHSDHYRSVVTGRSSVGRKGMKVHLTAGFIDQGFNGTITLELEVTHPIRVYADFRICQLEFTEPKGEPRLYQGRYQGQVEVTASRSHIGE